MMTYADVCRRMPTYVDDAGLLAYADVCHKLAYADVWWRMPIFFLSSLLFDPLKIYDDGVVTKHYFET